MELPADVRRVLWDVDPHAIDPELHLDFVIERVMARGNWAAMKWLREQIPRKRLVGVLERRGHRLSPRDLAYWRLVCNLPSEPQERGGGRPPWLP